MGLFVQCLYALSLHLVAVVFGTAIPTFLYIFGKCFIYFRYNSSVTELLYLCSVCVMDSRRSRRRERERRLHALETAEQKEARLAKRRLRDGAQRVSQSAVQRERTVQQRRERLIYETPENRQTRLLRMRQRTSHSSSFRFVPAISRQLDKTVTFTPHTIHLRMRSLHVHVHVATQRCRVQSTPPPFSCKGSPHNACISTSITGYEYWISYTSENTQYGY